MSDDVHDIDDLFKKKLENYAEETPPSAWEAVSHALNQQQATLYKRKYNRLKRAALLLSLLCMLGGVYIALAVWQGEQISSKQKQQIATLSSSNKINKSTADKTNSNVNKDVIENNNLQKKEEQKQKTLIGKNTASNENVFLSEQKQKAKTMGVEKKKLFIMASPSSFISTKNNNEVFVAGEKEPKQNKQQQEEAYNFNQPHPLEDSYLQPFSLKENKTIDSIKLQQILKDRKPALLSGNTSSSIKIKKREAHGFSLSLYAAPNISFERIDDDHHRGNPGGNEPDGHREEENNFSFSGGALLSYVNKNISLQSGISITAFSTFIAPKTVYAEADNNGHIRYQLNCSLGSAYLSPKGNAQLAAGDSSQTSEGVSKLVYINIPAAVSYHVNKGRFTLLPTIGAGLNILAGGKIKTGLDNTTSGNVKTTTSINGLNRMYMNGSMGFGVEYKLNRQLSIGIRPNAKFSLTPMNKEMPVKSYQNYLSVEAGVRIKL